MLKELEQPPTRLFTVIPYDLTGKHRDTALAIHPLNEWSVLLASKAMDQHIPRC